MPHKKMIFAHRGIWNKSAPENSLAAFKNAVDACIGIELDVRITKDGVPVVFHDKTLKRMCGDSRRISAVSFKELQLLRLDNTNEYIPTLSQALNIIDGKQPVLIETKAPKHFSLNHRLERSIMPIISDYNGEFLMQSFSKYSMRFLKRRFPRIKCGILSGHLYAEPHGFDFINYKAAQLTAEKISELNKMYQCVFGWSTDFMDLKTASEKLINLRLDAIITNIYS